jgi:hypothetical protein
VNYKLAKQLKDMGLAQGGKGSWTFPPDNLVTRHSDRVYVPTLEELIEACGERFSGLTADWGVKDWTAHDTKDANVGGCGSTPTEAVAKLWLALNKK